MLFGLIIFGSAIFVSIFVVLVRLRAFEKEFEYSIKRRRALKEKSRADMREGSQSRAKSVLRRSSWAHGNGEEPGRKRNATQTADSEEDAPPSEKPQDLSDDEAIDIDPIPSSQELRSPTIDESVRHPRSVVRTVLDDVSEPTRSRGVRFGCSPPPGHAGQIHESDTDLKRSEGSPSVKSPVRRSVDQTRHPLISFSGVGAASSSSLRPRSASRASTTRARRTVSNDGPALGQASSIRKAPSEPFLKSNRGFFSRNSAVYGLTLHERQHLGGYEYSAIVVLSILVPLYFVLFHLLGSIALGAWTQNLRSSTARANGLNPFWVGVS